MLLSALASLFVIAHGSPFEAERGPHGFALEGRLHLDGRASTSPTTTLLVKRARLGFRASLWDGLVTAGASLEFPQLPVEPRSVYVNVRPVRWLQLRVGNMLLPFSTDRLTSSNEIKHPERPIMVSNLVADRAVGVQLWGAATDERILYALGVFDAVSTLLPRDGEDIEIAARLAGRPVDPLFLAGSYRYDPPRRDASSPATVDTQDGQGIAFVRWDDDATRRGARHRVSAGPRVRWRFVEVSSEALVDRWERAGRGPATDATWVNWSTFVDAGVLVTGEDQGSGDVVPRRPVVGGPGPGAWEIAGRYEIVRVDADAFAQRAARGTSRIQSVTSTVVWSLAAGVRLLASYAYAFASDEAPLGKVRSVAPRSDEHMVTVRFDVHF